MRGLREFGAVAACIVAAALIMTPSLCTAVPIQGSGSGLQLWLDAQDASTLYSDIVSGAGAPTTPAGNGTSVGTWLDKSGNNYRAVALGAGRRPTRQDAAFNSTHTGIRFDGSSPADQGMQMQTFSMTQPYTVFMVDQFSGSVFGRVLEAQTQGANWLFSRYGGQAGGQAGFHGGGWVNTFPQPASGSFNPHIATGRDDVGANNTGFWVRGANLTTSPGSTVVPGSLGLADGGGYGGASEPVQADVGEVVIYNSALNNAARTIVEN